MSEIGYQDFRKICRFCLLVGDLIPLSECVFVNIFTQVTGFEVQLEGLPENICSSCEKVFQDFTNFLDLCKHNTEYLRSIYLNHTLKETKCDTVDFVDDFLKEEVICNDDTVDESDEDSKSLATIRECWKQTQKVNIHKSKKSKKTKTYKKHKLKDISTKTDVEKRVYDKNEPTKCDFCGHETTLGEIKKHYKLNSKCMPRNFKCSDCEKAFNRKHKLTAHMRSHTKEEPFECSICRKTFRFAQNLRRHRLAHNGIKPFKCEICMKEFSRQHVLNEHMNIHTGNNPYICTYCGKGFKRYANHFIHVYRHKLMNGEVEKKEITKKLYLQLQCDVCNKVFASRNGLLNHATLHEEGPRQKKFLCNDCGKGFMTNAQLESHSRIHTGDKPYECPDCFKRFRQRSAFNNHQLVHSGRRPHKCGICERLFTQSGHLKIHMRTHSGEKPYSCTFCDKKFALKSNLTVHTRIHTGETPYVCSECNMGFYDSSSLKKHKKGHGIANNTNTNISDHNYVVEMDHKMESIDHKVDVTVINRLAVIEHPC